MKLHGVTQGGRTKQVLWSQLPQSAFMQSNLDSFVC